MVILAFQLVLIKSNAKFVDNILEIFQQWWRMRRLSDLHCEIIRCDNINNISNSLFKINLITDYRFSLHLRI